MYQIENNGHDMGFLKKFMMENAGAVAVRRLHDVGKSGWFYLISLIPLIGGIWLFVLFVTEGDKGANQYGPDPKAPNAEEINEIGQIVAKSIVDFWIDNNNLTMVNNCLNKGVVIKTQKKSSSNSLIDKTFVFTGSLSLMNRSEAKNIIETSGGQTTNSVTKKTTHLVAGDNAGSKLDEAKELGISILSEEDFLALVSST